LANTVTVTGVSSAVVAASSPAVGALSSSAIVPTPWPRSIVALAAPTRLRKNVSSPSWMKSPLTRTVTVATVWPGRKVTVPVVAW